MSEGTIRAAMGATDLLLLNLAVVVTILAAVGLLIARTAARGSAPMRHGFLVVTLILILAAPTIVASSWHWKLGLVNCLSAPGWTAPGGPAAAFDGATATPIAAWVWHWSVLGAKSIWLAGAIYQAVLLMRGLWLVRRLRKSLCSVTDPRWLRLAEQACRTVGLSRHPALCVSNLVSSPVSLGWFRPVVVLPPSLDSSLGDAEIEGILVHETAHVARKDQWLGLVERVACTLFWWNPLVHRLCDELGDTQEELCDEYVVRSQGSGETFARCLLHVAEFPLRSQPILFATDLLGRRSLTQRVVGLLQKTRPSTTRLTPRATCAVALFALAAGGLLVAGTVTANSSDSPRDAISVARTRSPAQAPGKSVPPRISAGTAAMIRHQRIRGTPVSSVPSRSQVAFQDDGTSVAAHPAMPAAPLVPATAPAVFPADDSLFNRPE